MERWILIVMKYYYFYDKIEKKKIYFSRGQTNITIINETI